MKYSEIETRETLLFNLTLTALATLPPAGFAQLLDAHCRWIGLPQPLRIDMPAKDGSTVSGTPRSLWEIADAWERVLIVQAIDMALAEHRRRAAH